MPESLVEKNHDTYNDIEDAADWAVKLLNTLGGDFSISHKKDNCIYLKNKSSCPGLCLNAKKRSTCNEIELIMSKSIKFYGGRLSAGFIECSHDQGVGCVLAISMNP